MKCMLKIYLNLYLFSLKPQIWHRLAIKFLPESCAGEEIEILKILNSFHVIFFHRWFIYDTKMLIVTEFCEVFYVNNYRENTLLPGSIIFCDLIFKICAYICG